MNVLIGADPELFVKDAEGKLVSGHGMVEGDKKSPLKVRNGAVQVDGHALEFNIDPAANEDEFVTNLNDVMAQLSEMIPGYTLHADPVAKFGKKYLASMPDEANELGCDPDYNAYTGEANPRPDGDVDFRTGGGHVHIGWTKDVDIEHPEHVEACQMLAKELDYYLGIPSMFWDEEDGRRAMYGQAGAYRVKPYGVEYRSLSNKWLSDNALARYVDRQVRKAVANMANGTCLHTDYKNVAQIAIDNNDRALAQRIMEHLFPIVGADQDIPGVEHG